MRKLVFLALGLCGGCAIVAYGFGGAAALVIGVIAAIAAAVCLCIHKKCIALVCLGLMAGLFYTSLYTAFYVSDIQAYDETKQTLSITVTEYNTQTDYSVRCEGELCLEDKTYRVLFYADECPDLHPGDVVKGPFLLRVTTPGGSKEAPYHQGRGVYLIAYGRGEMTVQEGARNHIRYLPQRLRQTILNKLGEIFPEDAAGFAKALLLGETDDLTYLQDTALKISGIRHVVAVSGLHVSILFSLIYLLAGKQKWVTALLGVPILLLFAIMAGFSPSIVRACVMQLLMLLALLVRREYDPPSALAFGVLVILVTNPYAVMSVSFQLSCGCIVGIFLFCHRLRNYIYRKFPGFTFKAKALRAVLTAASVTISTMIVTVPLCAAYFGNISLVGVVTNLLTLWLVSFIFYGIFLAFLLSFLWLPMGEMVAAVVAVMIRFVLFVAESLSKLPLSAVYTASPYILLWLVLCYALFAVFWLRGRKHPAVIAGVMAVLLLVSVAFSYIEPRLEDYRVTVLDVGQGQCVLLQSRGETYVVDCGGSGDTASADEAVNLLYSQGITSIRGLIVTHYDRDHSGGVPYFLQRIPTEEVYLPNCPAPNDFLPQTQKTQQVTQISELSLGIGKLTLIPGAYATKENDDNENSTCVLFQVKECDILITGDRSVYGEARLMQQFPLPKLEILIAGHHGSKDSTGTALLEKTSPDTVVISVGKNNSYKHPAEETIIRLREFDCRILRTDQRGTITIRG